MRVGRASGRLDLLGGVADYSGALVLEVATRQGTTVTARPADAFVVGEVAIPPETLAALAARSDDDVRAALAGHPGWTHYLLGVALVLVRHGVIEPPAAALTVDSDLPSSVGVASSAALEVATARALGAELDPVRLAQVCQEAENRIVGAPCGIMDQLTVAVDRPGAVLPIRCRPGAVGDPITVPGHLEIVGWPTGAAHDVGGVPYRRARVAAFMAKRMVEAEAGATWPWVSDLPVERLDSLPEALAGAEFVERFAATDDPVTAVEPDLDYPVRAAAAFAVGEHSRTTSALASIGRDRWTDLGPLMAASHAGYDAMGLGHPAATDVVARAISRPGVIGARSSGGGSGGSVVVLCERGSLDDVANLVR